MPHMTLEYSDNVLDRPVPGVLLRELQDELIKSGPYKIEDVKTRLVVHEHFVVADGKKDQCFVHLQLAIMPRDEKVMQDTSDKLLAFLQDKFSKSKKDANCSFSVEIRLLEKDSYRKAISGTM